MKKFLKILLIVCALFVLMFLVYWRTGNDTELKTVNYSVHSKKLSAPIRLAVVSDLHSCKYGEGQQELLDAMEVQAPDIVLLAGDIYDDTLPDELADIFLKAIGTRYRCYYIPGNHELRKLKDANIETLLAKVSAYGIAVLYGECETVTVNGSEVNICGLMEKEKAADFSAQSFSELSKAAENGNFSVLMAHRPSRISTYLTGNFDLIVAGHAHGGQWRIPGVLNGLIAPNEGLFPKYAGGRYDFGDTTMIVSRGLALGKNVVPRIYNPPELVIVDLLPG